MVRTSFVNLLMKVDIFGEPIAANYINYKNKRNYKTNIGGFMSAVTGVVILIYTLAQLTNLITHSSSLEHSKIVQDFD